MIKFGIIGTNWITQQYVDAAHASKEWKLTAVYSRTLEKAHEFGDKNGATKFYDQIADMVNDDEIDAVYIASPNSLHFAQAKQVLEADKVAVVEKPIVANPTEWMALDKILKAHPQAKLFEAARHIHEPNFKTITQKIAEMDEIQGATLTYAKYSSRFDSYLSGNEPNIFSLKFAGGALQDLGVYLAYDAMVWFGMPDEVAYFNQKLRTGADGKGVAILRYPEYDVVLNIGKNVNSEIGSEIYGLKDTIIMDNAAELNRVEYLNASGDKELISTAPDENPMIAEATDFARVINDPDDPQNQRDYQEWLTLSRNVNKLLYNLRQNGKIYFTNEKEED
ncbi:Gfo/Idh/MocA family oxidoreductase [Pediococcus acidilactici]|uniref:Gfo/Idh/MocA family protein n=1 Tax=Pediococcus acidilactici TaxID=1254 RepID=UPI000E5D7FBD|nr:Gfo/Idh/MocA family oxidoreductase [Pediococcus acidilactici]KAF0514808.1 gfo/Idh/MocA family oxidoreductase [Pediococcus acidilactici]MCT3037686.1 gfo/Idh/MocA family oxidoreductase [Pediococcus acidilactici]QQC45195.1 Gfo/Idh/MocA family oxidoreductase [Pediococcus acidilactici]RJF52589.1 gfo/Idh/MocA family oxidoreductase [Pediococcus acidilactici]